MKKLLLIAITALTSLVAMAETKTYTDDLVVTINGESTDPQSTTVKVECLENGNINFLLKNFALGGEINVGTIEINDLPVVQGRRFNSFLFKGDVNIKPGDLDGVAEEEYIGPIISPIPLKLKGKMNDEKLYVSIDIDMTETLGQIIYVSFGSDFPALEVTSAKQYTDGLVVTINGESTEPQETAVTVATLETGDINFELKNFTLAGMINVGNILVEELMLEEGHGYKTFSFNGNLDITAGDIEGVAEEEYIGPFISPIPLKLTGKITDEKLYVTIDIDMMETLGQIIYVSFGTDIPNIYTITYAIDGETIATEQVEEGGTVTLPEAPEKEGYTFAGWTGVPETVTNDVTITGSYNINHYTVTYVIDGTTVGTEEVEYNGTPSAPEAPEKEGHTFAGWTGLPEKVTADVTVTGSYTVNTYTVYYKVDGRVVYSEEVAYGNPIPNFTITPESDDRYTRTFEGWDGEKYDTMPAHDVTYEAIISVVDGIESIHNSQFSNEVYDLSGRRVSQTKKGLYIKNGRVIVLK